MIIKSNYLGTLENSRGVVLKIKALLRVVAIELEATPRKTQETEDTALILTLASDLLRVVDNDMKAIIKATTKASKRAKKELNRNLTGASHEQ